VISLTGPKLLAQTHISFIDKTPSTQHSSLSTFVEFPGAPFILALLMLFSGGMIAWCTIHYLYGPHAERHL
jgi:hypothetical protein